ncbi:suppressor of fused domain protein [Rhizobium halophytocola]|uniref:Suppressor of fused domain protein n=1 Tax=Rhizobium halophytocola TaxID=735519 RepID=A0ABS4DX79_9HYPH|nr:suppressor of fused domain protein [Rhizobium halophytocola]MBP1850303.1 hypothetical protein [Rhizobium halophytocola]
MKKVLVAVFLGLLACCHAGAQTIALGDEDLTDKRTYAARDGYWSAIGRMEPDVLAPLVSAGLRGAAAWPTTRQAYRVIRRDGRVILATDGLSDPFKGVSGAGNGFEVELFIETGDIPDDLAGPAGTVGDLSRSWAFVILQQVAGMVAEAGGIRPQLQDYGVLSLEIPGVSASQVLTSQLPARFVTSDDAIGMLIGGPAPDFATRISDTPLSPVTVVPVVLLTARELEAIRKDGASARRRVTERLAARPQGALSDLGREDVSD